MIIIRHTFNGYPTDEPTHYFPAWLQLLQIEYWGGMGVGIFLFLSGYGLFLSLNKKTSIDRPYIVAKIKRLFEPFVIYWIVELLVLLVFNRAEIGLQLVKEIATLSIHPNIENWFFKVIVVVYIVTFCLFRWKMKNAYRIAIMFALSVAYLLVMMKLGFGQWWYNNILAFPTGAMVAYKYEWFSRQNALLMSAIGCCLLAALLLFHMNTLLFHLSFILFSIYAIRLVNIQNSILYFIGYNSLVFYFLECPVTDEIMMFSYSNFPLYCLLSVVGTYVLSYVCVRLFCLNKNYTKSL
jgi:hypothetical protein